MRDSGYPGYGNDGLNSQTRVEARLDERYSKKYEGQNGGAELTPRAVQDAVHLLDRTTQSLVQDKVATPPEPAKVIEDYIQGLNPSYIVAERSTTSQANISDNYKSFFQSLGT